MDELFEIENVSRGGSYPLSLELFRHKFQDPARVAETLPEIPNRWIIGCFEITNFRQKLSLEERMVVLNYYVNQVSSGLPNHVLNNTLRECVALPDFDDFFRRCLAKGVDWSERNRLHTSDIFY